MESAAPTLSVFPERTGMLVGKATARLAAVSCKCRLIAGVPSPGDGDCDKHNLLNVKERGRED
jgi:hypothetical protein